MAATPAWLASAEALLNRCIRDSAQAAALARDLQGTSLRIEVTGITSFRAGIWGGRLALLALDEPAVTDAAPPPAGPGAGAADASISGSLPALLQLFKSGRGRDLKSAAGRPAQIRGDAEIANRYRELFMLARPDPEEELSRWIGDIPARRLSQWAQRALGTARRLRRTAGENIAEYLQEEGRDLVNRTELEEFLRGGGRCAGTLPSASKRGCRASSGASRAPLDASAGFLHGCCGFNVPWSDTGWMTSCGPRTCTGRSASSSISRPGPGSRAASRPPAASGCAWRWRNWGPYSSNSARPCRRGGICCPPTSPMSWRNFRTAYRPSKARLRRHPSKSPSDCPCSGVFASFDPVPLAAASIAQVHVATLEDGREVVVKVLRPGMREIIDLDLEVLECLAGLADEYWREARRLRPVELVREYRKTILDELDLLREAGNAAQLKRNFAGSPLLYVPEVYWDYCRVDVMVMERIHGVIVNDLEQLRARGANIRRLAENGVEIFFTQVFRDNFFHADMHPGNIFVQVDDPENPRYAAVDFGIVGTLQPRDQHYLAENFLAFFDRDYGRVAALHVESGWVPAGTRVDELESAVRTVCEPIFNKPLKEISFAQVLLRLFETARRFDMQVQPQLILLQKTLFNIEGLGRQLYPELDLWQTAQPYLRRWMRERMSPRAVLRRARAQFPDFLLALQQLPQLFQTGVREAAEGRLRMQVQSTDTAELRAEIRRGNSRRDAAIAAAVLWLSGLAWLAMSAQMLWLGWLQMIAAIALYLGSRSAKLRGE